MIGQGPKPRGQFVPYGKHVPQKQGIVYYTATGVQECEICEQLIRNGFRAGFGFYDLCNVEMWPEYFAMARVHPLLLAMRDAPRSSGDINRLTCASAPFSPPSSCLCRPDDSGSAKRPHPPLACVRFRRAHRCTPGRLSLSMACRQRGQQTPTAALRQSPPPTSPAPSPTLIRRGPCLFARACVPQCYAQQRVLQSCPEYMNNWCYQDLGGLQQLRAPCPNHLTCQYCLGISPLYCTQRYKHKDPE